MSGSDGDAHAGRSATGRSTRYLACYGAGSLLFALLVIGVNFVVDPLQIYRAAGPGALYIENQRYQNAGLARNVARGTVVVGTSHAENFLPSHVERILGGPATKLAIEGGTAYEQRRVLETALASGRVARVVWILDFMAFRKAPEATRAGEGAFPEYLYADGAWLERARRYTFSLDTLMLSGQALLGLGHRDLEGLNTWHHAHSFGTAAVLRDYRRRAALIDAVKRDPTRSFAIDLRRVRESLRLNLVRLVRSHPEVEFILVFPPFSMAAYLADLRISERTFDDRQAYKAMVVRATDALPNASVFDFQGAHAISERLEHYKDLEHYGLEVNDWMPEAIVRGEHRVRAGDYAERLARDKAWLLDQRRRVCGDRGALRLLCPG